MKVLFFATHAIQYHVPLYRELSKSVDLTVVYMMKQSPGAQSKAGFGVEFEWDIPMYDGYMYRFLTNLSADPSSSRWNGVVLDDGEIESVLSDINPGVVCVHGWFPKGTRQVIRHCHKRNIPVISRGDSNLLMGGWLRAALKRFLHQKIFVEIDHFLQVGINNALYYDYMHIPESKRSFGLHCVDTGFFQEQFSKYPKHINQKFVIGLAGKLIEKKRPLDLLRAVHLSRNKDRISILIIGEGPLSGMLRNYAMKKGLDIEFTGFLNQSQIVEKGYCRVDLLVMCSAQFETWGLVVNEAMTGGIPAILSDRVGCAPDLIEEGMTGYTYKAGDVKMLSARIDEWISKNDSGFDFRSNVLERISHYSLEGTASAYLKAIRNLA